MMPGYVFLLIAISLLPTQSQRIHSFKNWATLRDANWSSLLHEPSAFVVKSHVRLRNRPEGYQPVGPCLKYVGMGYLDHIKESRQTLCGSRRTSLSKDIYAAGASNVEVEPALSSSESSVECFTAPYIQVGNSNKATISLCRSRNLVLTSCAFFAGRRKGTLNKKFPVPARGAVQLGCTMTDYLKIAGNKTDLQWLKSIHHDVWWSNTTRNDSNVGKACAAGSKTLVTTPTLFVMRDRHANYAHEMEVVSMAFSFLAALEPVDVAEQGVQVVIVDQAPPTGFLETWARISRPHRLRILAHDPFPPNTCFRSAYHVYTFAAGIGYNTNGETITCESPVATGMSHWLRQLYEERDPEASVDMQVAAPLSAAATAGPVAAAAGLRGLRAPTSGIVMKNVVWLSRRNLEMVRLLLNASVGWKSMRMVRNEDEVVAAILAAVQEWNSESCLVRRFERDVKRAYVESLHTVNAVHKSSNNRESGGSAKTGAARRRASADSSRVSSRTRKNRQQRKLLGSAEDDGPKMDPNPYDVDLENVAKDLELNLRAALRMEQEHKKEQEHHHHHLLLPLSRQEAYGDGSDKLSTLRISSTTSSSSSSSIEDDGDADADDGNSDDDKADDDEADDDEADDEGDGDEPFNKRRAAARVMLEAKAAGGSDIDEHGNDGDDETEEVDFRSGTGNRGVDETGWGMGQKGKFYGAKSGVSSSKSLPMESFWDDTKDLGDCRPTNVLFTFVDGDFNDMPYHQQLKLIFRTGVLVGVHGAGLTHGFFMPPGQSAVLQLLGDSFAKVAANNVFRNMAVGLGNLYEDVMYEGVDVKVNVLKQAVKRAMDFVSEQVRTAQLKEHGGVLPPLVLDDQNHFSIVVPSPLQCPRNRTMALGS